MKFSISNLRKEFQYWDMISAMIDQNIDIRSEHLLDQNIDISHIE